ncbi:MAG: hypothetical protein K0Q76_1551 [Panacagrimonas sp.]|jgi:hypothetical protein|nr:FecR domain-containing protein [Panacagrimonas sp.]MCC2656443.1 hypothetical protein [Panacagrimonas sp.]
MHSCPARRPPHRGLPLVVALVLAVLAPLAPRAADAPQPVARVATVKTLHGPATVERDGRTLPLQQGMALLQSDTVVTGNGSTVGLGFDDEALVSLGPDSRLLIDRFRFDRTTHGGEFDATLSRGRMAVVSGKIAKSRIDAMKVRTPTALLGVRGTEFVVDAGP